MRPQGFPQATQTVYKGGVSCTDSIFASTEALAKFKLQGDNVYSYFYDLASAFNTVEFCVLLQSLFHARSKGKWWRLLRDWYCNLTSLVKLDSYMSEPFAICCGIHEGSILSPMLFNLVMDPLLSEMISKSLGISINSLFLGAFARENKWLKFWDVALEYGYDESKSSLAILKSLCLTVFSDLTLPNAELRIQRPTGCSTLSALL